MEELYIRRFEKISQQLTREKIKVHARLPGKGERTFTRNRKMPLQDIILCCLAKKRQTTVFELRKYFQCESRVETEQEKSSGQAAEDMEKQAREGTDLGSELNTGVVIQPVKEALNRLTAHTYKSRKSIPRAQDVPTALFAGSGNLNVMFGMQQSCPLNVNVGFVSVKSATGNWTNIPHDLPGSSQIVLWGRSNHQGLGQGKPAGIALGKSMKFYPIIILASGRIVAFPAYF